jgi:dTDP-4-dehydrorhamnose reductase
MDSFITEKMKTLTNKNYKILVLGATGMLGSTVLRLLSQSTGFEVVGSVRTTTALQLLPPNLADCVISGIDVDSMDSLLDLFGKVRPDVVINCVGLVKQLAGVDDPLTAIPINALLPHRLARICGLVDARLVHISTDCVFSGAKGMYTEADMCDAKDMYGISKFIGEVDAPQVITLRTSIIGHELSSAHSVVSWFLAQQGTVKGFTRAIFSGLPTIELARVIRDFVIPYKKLSGLYHVAAQPIDKFNLLKLIANEYGKSIDILPDDNLIINRSLDASRFQLATGFIAPEWPDLVRIMQEDYKSI